MKKKHKKSHENSGQVSWEESKIYLFSGYPLTEKTIKEARKSLHMADRSRRIEKALELDANPEIDRVFQVDRQHSAGTEVHVVTKCGIVYIFNTAKLLLGGDALVTIFIARPNQLQRLYSLCKDKALQVPETILAHAAEHQAQGFNLY